MNDSLESSGTNGKKLFWIALTAAVIFAVASFFFNNQSQDTIEIRASVTIANPQGIGLDPNTCDASMLAVRLTSNSDPSKRIDLGMGDVLKGSDGDACLYTFSVETPLATEYTLSATGSGLPPRTIDRVPERLFNDEDGRYLLWSFFWEQ